MSYDKHKVSIEENRAVFLEALRSGKYKKGTIRSDEKGQPIINSKEDDDGYCACAIMCHLFDPEGNTSTVKAREALGITGEDCRYIQHDLNDSPLTFPEIADVIDERIFQREVRKKFHKFFRSA